jgi:lipid A 3-O-deacylase
MRSLVVAASLGFVLIGSAAAEDPIFLPGKTETLSPEAQTRSIFSEFRAGNFRSSAGADALFGPTEPAQSGEILFNKPVTASDPWIDALLPRPLVGSEFNAADGIGSGYAGFAWTFNLTENLSLEGSLSSAFSSVMPDQTSPLFTLAPACDLSFRETARLGLQLSQSWTMQGVLQHSNSGALCSQGSSETNAALRFDYKF